MYRPNYKRQEQRSDSPNPENEIDQSQTEYSLFQCGACPIVQRIIQNYQFTCPWSVFDQWVRQVLPAMFPSRNTFITERVSPDTDNADSNTSHLEWRQEASGNADPDTSQSECRKEAFDNADPDKLREERNSTPGSKTSDTDSVNVTNQTQATPMKYLQNQLSLLKCDYCGFKAPKKGIMRTHFEITGHTHAAEVMGYFENGTFHCKSIIEPAAVHFFAKRKHMNRLTDLVIMCPICFSHFSTMFQCADHAIEKHGENVYGVGEVVGQHTITLPFGLRCLCSGRFKEVPRTGKHRHTCRNYQISSEPNISYFYVCPFCIQFFNSAGFYSHIQSETKKHNHRGNVRVAVVHVRHPTASRAMLPYALGPTLQDT